MTHVRDLNSYKFLFPYATSTDLFSAGELAIVSDSLSKIELGDGGLYEKDGNITTTSSHRKSKIAFIRNGDTELSWILDKISFAFDRFNDEFFHFDISGYEFAQYAEYKAEDGGHYNWHLDLALDFASQGMVNNSGLQRKLSMTVLLNNDFEGGDFEITSNGGIDSVKIPMAAGSVLVFPSFVCHRVTPVTKGVRKSLVAWMLGPRFR